MHQPHVTCKHLFCVLCYVLGACHFPV